MPTTFVCPQPFLTTPTAVLPTKYQQFLPYALYRHGSYSNPQYYPIPTTDKPTHLYNHPTNHQTCSHISTTSNSPQLPPEHHSQHTPMTNVKPHIRSPTVEIPLFYGDNAYQWLQDCEGVFELAGIGNN
jgi:hypothetical protein